MFALHVLRRDMYNTAGLFTPHYERPVILAADAASVEEICRIQENDVVMIKGTVNTRNLEWDDRCPQCGSAISCKSTLSTVYPAPGGIKILYRPNTRDDSVNYLRTVAEFSNIVKIQGYVCVPPKFHAIEGKGMCTMYQLAVNRKLYVYGSTGEEDHTDYPWIYSYGKQAEEDIEALSVGSQLYIDGYLHTTKYPKTIHCPECGGDITTKTISMTITPYSCEYGEGCHKPEPAVHGIALAADGPGHDIEE